MSNAQILLVEDESIVARDVRNRLRNMGYEVPAIAASGEEALRKAEETSPDLVLMDIVLKGEMDGVEASAQMRQRFNIPVIFLTAYVDDPTLQRAKLTGPFGYLLKPFEERELHSAIEIALYRHRIEEQLKKTEQWLATTLRSIGDGVIATDARGRVQLINPVAEARTGWTGPEATGMNIAEVFNIVNAETFHLTEDHLTRALREGVTVELPDHSILCTRDFREVPVEGTVARLEVEGEFTGYVLAFRDITQRQQAEETQHQLEAQLFQAQKMQAIGRLAGGIAHDFNNLLTAILGNTALMLGSLRQDDPNHAALEAVEKASLRAADLVRQLLGFSRQTRLRLGPVNLNDSVQEMFDLLRPVVDPRIEIKVEGCAELWKVQADPSQVHQVLLNLCLNSRDAMPEGGLIVIATENVVVEDSKANGNPQARPGEYVCLRFRDTGHGIPAAIQSRIFEPFFTTKELGKGTGLGLAMVFGIVEQHHGWIECRNDLEPGTRFDIYWPRYFREAEVIQAPAKVEVDSRPRLETKKAPASPGTVLLADDEPMLRDLGRAILSRQGYEVLLAEDGVQAIEVFQRERRRIDLVILDLTMPRLSGRDAFRKLLEIDPMVSILFSSGYSAEDVPEHNRVLGFLAKPYRPENLLNTVRSALEHSGTAQLEQAIAADSTGRERDWLEQVAAALTPVQKALRQRAVDSETLDGQCAEVDLTRPSLARRMTALDRKCADLVREAFSLKEEAQSRAQACAPGVGAMPASEGADEPVVVATCPDVSAVRQQAERFLSTLCRQRQEEGDLVVESVNTDLGVGD